MTISLLCYYVFGDSYTSELFILRNQLEKNPTWADQFFKFLMVIFFLISAIGLCVYSEALRKYLEQFIDTKKSKVKYILCSLGPFAAICLISSQFPYIETLVEIFTFTVYNFNGYILVLLIGSQVFLAKKMSKIWVWLC